MAYKHLDLCFVGYVPEPFGTSTCKSVQENATQVQFPDAQQWPGYTVTTFSTCPLTHTSPQITFIKNMQPGSLILRYGIDYQLCIF
jgi:hypothetical protein